MFSKVWIRDSNLLIQQGCFLHIGTVGADQVEFERRITISLENVSENVSVTCEFRDFAIGTREHDFIRIGNIDNIKPEKKIFLPEDHTVETLLLSHLQISKHLIFISTRRKGDKTAWALFCDKWVGNVIFKICVTSLIDVLHPANLVFCSKGIFLEGRIPGNDYPAVTLWKCWSNDGQEMVHYEYSSDFGMMLTGSHAGQMSPYSSIITPENDTHLTASGTMSHTRITKSL